MKEKCFIFFSLFFNFQWWRHQESTSGVERNWHFQKVILQPHGLYSPWNSPGYNTGVGSLSFLQGSSQSRDQTQVLHIAGRFFTSWATREALDIDGRRRSDDRGWDGWMVSLIQWTWIWTSSGRWQRAGKPVVLHIAWSQRVGHDWETEPQQVLNNNKKF